MTGVKNYVQLCRLEEIHSESHASCNFCGYVCITRSELATHLSLRHSDTVFHCEICDGIFCESKTHFIKHMQNHEDQFKTLYISKYMPTGVFNDIKTKRGSFPCRACGRIFLRKAEMVKHMRCGHQMTNTSEALGNGSFQNINMKLENCIQEMNDKVPCSICGDLFTSRFDLKRHNEDVHFLKLLKNMSENSNGSGELQQVSESSTETYSRCDRNPDCSSKLTCSMSGQCFARKPDGIRDRKHFHFIKESSNDAVGVCANNIASDLARISMDLNKEVICRICGRMFTRKADMKRHVKNVHHMQEDDRKPNKSHGSDSFTTGAHLLLSGSESSSMVEQKDASSIIGFKSKREDGKSSADAISRVKIKVDGKTYFRCQVCGKNLFRRCTYVRHMRIHTGEKPFTCHVCGKQFRAEPQIQRHVREVHEGIKEHACPICGRKFANTRTRNDHVTVHTGERRLVCHLCGKRFKTRATFHTHKRSHTNLFPHKCTHCGKSFRRQYECTKHMMIHTGERPHACDICGKCFRYQNDMIRHKLVHSDHKPFKCTMCHLSFRQERYLKNHNMKTHEGSQMGGRQEDVHLEEIGNIN